MSFLLVLAFVVAADQTVERAGVVARATVAPNPVALVGDVTLTLTVEADAPLSVEPVKFAALPGWSLVETAPAVTETLPANRAVWRASFRLSPERPGELPLPPPALRVRAAGRQSVTEIAWEPFAVRVETTLAGATLDEAKGVAGPIRPPEEPASLTPWLIAAGLAATAAFVAVLARRRQPSIPTISPEDEARSRFAALTPFDVDALDAAIRKYLVRRGIAADRLTTVELRATLDANWLDLFRRCDLARYASQPFDAAEWDRLVARAQSLIPASLPVGEAAPVAGVGENASSRGDSSADTPGN